MSLMTYASPSPILTTAILTFCITLLAIAIITTRKRSEHGNLEAELLVSVTVNAVTVKFALTILQDAGTLNEK